MIRCFIEKKKAAAAYKFFDAFPSAVPHFMTLLSAFDTEWSAGKSIPLGAEITYIDIFNIYLKNKTK